MRESRNRLLQRTQRLFPLIHNEFVTVSALFLAGLLLRVLILAPTGFDGLYGQDAYAYYDFAGELLNFAQSGQPPGPFHWPVGYPLFLALAFAAFGASAVVAQLGSLLLGALLSPLVYLLARQVGGRPGALAAAALMAVCGQALQSSLVVMADIPALAWAAFSAAALWRYAATDRRRWLAAAAYSLTLAGLCRWLYLLLGVPWGLALLLVWRGKARWPARLLHILAAGIAVLLAFAPQMAYNQVNPTNPLDHAWVRGWSPGNMFKKTFDTVDGRLEYEKINLTFYAQPFYDPYYLAPVLTPFTVAGALATLRRRRFEAATLMLGWALLPYLFLAGIPYQNVRFALIIFPPLAVLTGIGLESAAQWLAVRDCLRLRRYVVLLPMAALALGVVQTFAASQPVIAAFLANQQRDKVVVQWAAGEIPDGAHVYTFGLTLTFRHYTALDVYDLYYEPPALLRQRWRKGRDDYLVVNVYNLENQWKGLTPQAAYHWLRDERGLVRLGSNGSYTLFKVKG